MNPLTASPGPVPDITSSVLLPRAVRAGALPRQTALAGAACSRSAANATSRTTGARPGRRGISKARLARQHRPAFTDQPLPPSARPDTAERSLISDTPPSSGRRSVRADHIAGILSTRARVHPSWSGAHLTSRGNVRLGRGLGGGSCSAPVLCSRVRLHAPCPGRGGQRHRLLAGTRRHRCPRTHEHRRLARGHRRPNRRLSLTARQEAPRHALADEHRGHVGSRCRSCPGLR